jgi:hypothetical protein
MTNKIHPELLDELNRAGTSSVQAVVQLHSPGDVKTLMSPEETSKLADVVLERVTAEVGRPATRTNVLRNLATLVVEADPAFLNKLISQPEVLSALPNRTNESPFIPPKRKRPVK